MNGSFFVVFNYLRLSTVTMLSKYSIICLNKRTDRLGKAKLFSTFDINLGFWRIKINRKEINKTAFRGTQRIIQIHQDVFGYRNVTFHRANKVVLATENLKYNLIYTRSPAIFSSKLEKYLQNMPKVVKLLNSVLKTIKLKNALFIVKQSILGSRHHTGKAMGCD